MWPYAFHRDIVRTAVHQTLAGSPGGRPLPINQLSRGLTKKRSLSRSPEVEGPLLAARRTSTRSRQSTVGQCATWMPSIRGNSVRKFLPQAGASSDRRTKCKSGDYPCPAEAGWRHIRTLWRQGSCPPSTDNKAEPKDGLGSWVRTGLRARCALPRYTEPTIQGVGPCPGEVSF